MEEEKILESVLEDLLAEIAGPLTESCQPAYDLVEKCAEEENYDGFPPFLQKKLKSAQSAMNKYKSALEEVARIGSSDESTDHKLRDIYNKISGHIRNGANCILQFATICETESKILPNEIMQMVKPATDSWGRFMTSNERIGRILDRLPPGKTDEYQAHHASGKYD